MDPKIELLRHTLATLAYRARKCVANAPAGFADFSVSPETRTPGQILAHIGDLLDWGLSLAKGKQRWHDTSPLPWEQETARFFASLQALEDYLASGAAVAATAERLFQGPVADALTHVGQIAMLRRIAGGPVRPENYHKADIAAGRVGVEQAPAVLEF